MAKMNIKKGDKVKVLAGKDKGAEGIVIASNPSASARHRRKGQHDEEGNAPDPGKPCKAALLPLRLPSMSPTLC